MAHRRCKMLPADSATVEYDEISELPKKCVVMVFLYTLHGRGGAVAESKPFDRRVVDPNPSLAATWGPWASP